LMSGMQLMAVCLTNLSMVHEWACGSSSSMFFFEVFD
jgi:hypothetical protein